MTTWRIRDLHAQDLDGVLGLWQGVASSGVAPVYGLAEVLASCEKDHAVVAVRGEEVVGAAVGRAAHAQGWVVFLATAPPWQGQGVGEQLLAALERRMTPHGLTKLSALVPETGARVDGLVAQGYEAKQHLRYFERQITVQRGELTPLRELGGRVMPRGLWDRVAGMQAEKHALERRLVAPLARPGLAERYGVVPPRAVVLFGPPGTGKTTFAKAIASRLDWPFVEVFPSRLAADAQGLAGALRATFDKIAELEHAVVFIDEVEEIAAQRHGDPPSPLQGVTNELLKIIPAFRDQPGRLLICATNFIRALDPAFLRHGRFDYVIPIGLPDEAARRAIWARYLPEAVAGTVDLAPLVASSEGFSPADIEHAARQASQTAFEVALEAPEGAGPGAVDGPSTAGYLAAVASTRATVSEEVAVSFSEDIATLARV